MSGKHWWERESFAGRRPGLMARAAIKAALAADFAAQGFVEVETPCLQVSPGMEPHIMALATTLAEPLAGGSAPFYLHTSPEFSMKKLLVAGMERIYQFAHVWRDGERSPLHHPEFTMLEWYRAQGTIEDLIGDCHRMMAAAARAAGVAEFRRGGRRCDPFLPPVRIGVCEAVMDRCGIDLLATAPDPYHPDRDLLAAEAGRIGLHFGAGDSWEDIFFRIMLEHVEPTLGDGRAVVLGDYPVSLAALSRPSAKDPRLAERFELYACGVELANAFGELTDPVEQRRRFEADMDLKERLYGLRYPIDEDFMAALDAGMPPAAGIALGFDRLAMLATGAETLADILWAPVAEPGIG